MRQPLSLEQSPDTFLSIMPPISGSMDPLHFLCSHLDCNKRFAKVKYLRRHQKVHERESKGLKPSFICPKEECVKVFWSQKDVDKHVKTPHGPEKKSLSCQHCGKEFKHRFDVRIHEAIHTGERPLTCDTCGAGFALRARLRQHMKRHKMYTCPHKVSSGSSSSDSCSFTCDKWTQLRKHVSLNHRKQCPSCTKKFTNTSSLEKHIASHSLLFKCHACDLTYSNRSNLATHVRSVHEKVTYKCPFEGCDSQLLHRKSLRNHMKSHRESNRESQMKSEATISNPCKKLITKRNVVMAELVTGETADGQEREEILHQDKKFRSEFTEFQNEVRIC